MDERRFYVYEHIRPDRGSDGEVFYVGKGYGRRANKLTDRNLFHAAIQGKLSRLGLCVEVRLVATGLTEDEAFALECERIAYWRADGCDLANITDGGEGMAGYSPTPETRAKISAAGKGRKHTAEARAAISAKNKGRKLAPELVQAMRERATGKKQSPESIAKRVAATTGRKNTPETLAKMSEAAKKRGVSPEHLAKLLASTHGRVVSDETKARQSAAMSGKKKSAEHVEKVRAANAGKKRSGEALDNIRMSQQDPAVKAKISAANKAAWARRKAAKLAESNSEVIPSKDIHLGQ